MTISITLDRLVQSNASLMELGNLQGVPPKTGYEIGQVIKITRDMVRGWSEQRTRIIREMFPAPEEGSKDPPKVVPHPASPGDIWVKTELLTMAEADAMKKALDDLGSSMVAIDRSTIGLAALGANAQVKPNVFADLDWLIVP